ncbi:hypothetical protein [Spiroplasma alleghenense]|uniref:Uncharacterized protein n=1 Tax=Spiroplasma alleghenense TaxID=216931 RepID=A0A345Z2W8_9MOLU|nr:hypothetical protein [Spiroplasma alleghenense]AXK50947.1 hypothetical protein SALLE_v1c02710 [Spiroplasma alleghenense]
MGKKNKNNTLTNDVVYEKFLNKYFPEKKDQKLFKDHKSLVFGKRMKKPIWEFIFLSISSLFVLTIGILYFVKSESLSKIIKNDYVFLFISLTMTVLILLRIGNITIANYRINESFISDYWTKKYCKMENIAYNEFRGNKVYDLIFLDLMDKIDHKKFPNLRRMLYSCFYIYFIFIIQILVLANMTFDEEGTKSVIEIVIPTIDSLLVIYISKEYVKTLAQFYRDHEYKLIEYINFFDLNNSIIDELTVIINSDPKTHQKALLNFANSLGKLRRFELYVDLSNILKIMIDNNFIGDLDLRALKYYLFITNLALGKILVNQDDRSENTYIMKLFIDEAIK